MKLPRRIGLLMVGLIVSLNATVLARQAPGEKSAQAGAVAKWSLDVWQTALKGDEKSLDELFKNLPLDAATIDDGVRFRDSINLYFANNDKAQAKRIEARDKAVGEMHEYLASNDLSKALRAAVTVQTLSDNLEAAFHDDDVNKIIAWAKQQVPQVEADLDWLLAQELLYYLRTLYEDTGKFAEYKSYKDQLDAVNRRVSLLAQYAPRKLHELRALRAQRLGEKPLSEYRANDRSDWKSRIRGIKPEMLKAALKQAAKDHIEAKQWRPLLRGGLQELRLLATTTSLDETFPKLGDPVAVKQWVAHIDRELATLDAAKDDDIDSWRLTGILNDLLVENDKTVQLPAGVIYREFGDGATYELDEFTEIIWPDKLPRFKQATEGAFVGVGILIRHNDAQEIVVVNPLEGTPAYFGGVKPNDKIVEVDGDSTVGWNLNDAVDRITGSPATKVKLGLRREGADELVPITLTRDVIKLRSVTGWWKRNLRADGTPDWDWFIDAPGRIAYIKLTQFTEDSYSDLLDAWREITATCGKPAGLILDLRYDPGGLLTAAVSISNLFVKDGVIVSGEDKDGHKAWSDQRADPTKAAFQGVPTVVLVNQGSASASEIVSGCLQAHSAAVIVGERSFGKGSVQTVHKISDDARLKLTTQYYRLPANAEQIAKGEPGRLVHKRVGATIWGVDPDILVKMTPEQVKDSLELRQQADVIPQDKDGKLTPESPERPNVNKLLVDGLDPQLETALLILQARAMATANDETRHARSDK